MLVGTQKRAEKLAADHSFRVFHKFHEHVFAVERYLSKVALNKSIYTGATVLELSKLLMFDFHYDFMKKKVSR